jgi:hypothetical protein
MLKGNKGEWTELYAFARILADGKLHQATLELEKDDENCYEVVKAYREDSGGSNEYVRTSVIKFYRHENGDKSFLGELPIEFFESNATKLLDGTIAGKGKSFEVENASDFIDKAKIEKLTALSNNKSDIKLRIYDHRLAKETDLGFSIKSMLGKDSTLFNTGLGNNFIFKVNGSLDEPLDVFNRETYAPGKRKSKMSYRIQVLEQRGLNLSFTEIQSRKLWLNLKMIDGDLPEILAYALLYRYKYEKNSVQDVVNILEENDPMSLYAGLKTNQKLYENKVARFLTECAMGMTSETEWLGDYDATGGAIICKRNGDVLCFHVYDFNLFRRYLLANTRFEQPSTGEDGQKPGTKRTDKKTKKFFFGWLYESNKELAMKLNLQVRFS